MNRSELNMSTLAATLEGVAGALEATGKIKESKYIGLNDAVAEMIEHLMTAMFPYHLGKARERFEPQEKRTWELMRAFDSIKRTLGYLNTDSAETDRIAMELIEALPQILAIIETDVQAAYEGDPAAISPDEIILTYPAFQAISIQRLAHVLYRRGVSVIPRMMTEYAHRLTGIDIHPGAEIGPYFFIDHGTGVVIGETTVIGEHVKLYQHVTLGAKSFAVNDDGTLVKGIKRHPNIGNNVIIYAGATILGGDTFIGDNCVVGSNVWVTQSLAPGTVLRK